MQTRQKEKNSRQTLLELFKKDSPIWVRNLTGRPNSRWDKPGDVILQAGNGHDVDPIKVPPGDDPVCLSDMTDYESLKSCRDLFKSVRVRTLEILDPKEAETYYTVHEDRFTAIQEKLDAYTSKRLEDSMPKEVESQAVNLHPRINDICLKLKHKALPERQALERLLESSGMFGVDDYSYLLANGRYKSIKTWAKDKLEELAKEVEGE